MQEIEYKFRISEVDLQALRVALDLLTKRRMEIVKKDSYYEFDVRNTDEQVPCQKLIRIRAQQKTDFETGLAETCAYLTYKEKHISTILSDAAILRNTSDTAILRNAIDVQNSSSILLEGEVNKEYEIAIDNPDTLDYIFRSLGARLYIKKQKIASAFILSHVVAGIEVLLELVEVPPLGYFLEIEALLDDTTHVPCDNDDGNNSPRIKQRIYEIQGALLDFVKTLGIDIDTQIESRMYMDMLKKIEES